jgi:MraZ protein
MEKQGSATEAGGTATTAPSVGHPAFGHAPFSGHYRTRVEGNGRLSLPAAFKHAFADAAVVRGAANGCLLVMTPRAFELVVDALRESDPDLMLDSRKRQLLFMGSPRVSVDRQSRLVLPPELRDKVGLVGEAEVVVGGAIERLEIWPASRWDADQAPGVDDVDRLFDTFGGLSTDPV